MEMSTARIGPLGAGAGFRVGVLVGTLCTAVLATGHATPLPDLERLQRPASPNSALTGPPDWPPGEPDTPAAVFDIGADRLAGLWQRVVRSQPRTRIVAVSADGLQVEAEQRSALFGFVDDISFRALALGPQRSTFIAYSRSRVGYWDLGVNRRRLETWTAALRDAAGAQED